MNLTWIVYKKQFPLNCNYPRKFLENSNFFEGYSNFTLGIGNRLGILLTAIQVFLGILTTAQLNEATVINEQINLNGSYIGVIMTATLSFIALSSDLTVLMGTINRVGEILDLLNKYHSNVSSENSKENSSFKVFFRIFHEFFGNFQ